MEFPVLVCLNKMFPLEVLSAWPLIVASVYICPLVGPGDGGGLERSLKALSAYFLTAALAISKKRLQFIELK